jgi:hypothetical protein
MLPLTDAECEKPVALIKGLKIRAIVARVLPAE